MKLALQDQEAGSDWRDVERRALADVHLAGQGWVGLAASALTKCITEPVEDAWMFPWTQGHWARHGDTLRVLAKGAHAQTHNLTEDYPLLITLAKYWAHSNPPPVATLLLRVVIEYHLRSQHMAVARELMEFIRGLLTRGERHPLERTLGAAVSIRKLLSMMGELEVAAGPSGALIGHGDDFLQLGTVNLHIADDVRCISNSYVAACAQALGQEQLCVTALERGFAPDLLAAERPLAGRRIERNDGG